MSRCLRWLSLELQTHPFYVTYMDLIHASQKTWALLRDLGFTLEMGKGSNRFKTHLCMEVPTTSMSQFVSWKDSDSSKIGLKTGSRRVTITTHCNSWIQGSYIFGTGTSLPVPRKRMSYVTLSKPLIRCTTSRVYFGPLFNSTGWWLIGFTAPSIRGWSRTNWRTLSGKSKEEL